MRDSISGRIDSFFVTKNQTITSPNNNVGITVSEYYNGHINPDSLTWVIDLSSNLFLLNIEAPKPFYVTNGKELFSYPFNANNDLNILQTYFLNGTRYNNVAEIHFIAGYSDNWYFINTDIGFIKIILHYPMGNINYIWELQRYNIMR
jgi:hypothetical protein